MLIKAIVITIIIVSVIVHRMMLLIRIIIVRPIGCSWLLLWRIVLLISCTLLRIVPRGLLLLGLILKDNFVTYF